MSGTLKNQVAIITGAGSGIGAAAARRLAAEGAHLVLNGRTQGKLQALAEELNRDYPGIKASVAPGDVSDPQQAKALVDQTMLVHGQVDVLVNNAGVAGKIALMQEVPVEEVHRTIDINLKGAIFMMQEVLRQSMVPRQRGAILNINSIAGKTAFPYWSLYVASKHGLRAVTEAVAEEQRSNNIKVVGLYPGAVDTPLWETIELAHDPNREGMVDPETIADMIVYILCQPAKVVIPDVTITPLKPAL